MLKSINKNITSWIVTIPDHLKTHEMCDEAVRTESLSLAYVLDRFKTQKMCNEVVRNNLYLLLFAPDHFWTQEMCNEVMRTMPDAFHRISDRFKTQEMCDKAVKKDHYSLQFVPDGFEKQQHIGLFVFDDWIQVFFEQKELKNKDVFFVECLQCQQQA